MKKIVFKHVPNYHYFYIIDSDFKNDFDIDKNIFNKEDYYCNDRMIYIGTKSEFTEIPISIEVYEKEPKILELIKGDKYVECKLDIKSEKLILKDSVGDEFGEVSFIPNMYNVRVYFGSQDYIDSSGETEDYYIVQLWPENE